MGWHAWLSRDVATPSQEISPIKTVFDWIFFGRKCGCEVHGCAWVSAKSVGSSGNKKAIVITYYTIVVLIIAIVIRGSVRSKSLSTKRYNNRRCRLFILVFFFRCSAELQASNVCGGMSVCQGYDALKVRRPLFFVVVVLFFITLSCSLPSLLPPSSSLFLPLLFLTLICNNESGCA